MRLALRLSIAFSLLFAVLATAAPAGTIFVNTAATGANNGSSWADAYKSLQPALTAAGSGDEIWVAAGTYLPAVSDRNASFALKNGVGIYGGFLGNETLRSQRDPLAHLTILSGDIGTPSVSNDNSYHVVTAAAAVTSTGVLDGFTITAGQADGAPASNQDKGAGMWDNGGAPTLSHVIFTGNFASEGAGLRVTNGAPTILNCSFLSNSVPFSGSGAGLKSGGGSTIYAQNCVFRSNSMSGATAGGAGLDTGGNVTLVNCVIAQNNPSGVHFDADNNTIRDCTIANNTAYGAAFIASSGNTISNSILWGNGVDQIFNDGLSTITATYCDIQGGFAGAGNITGDPAFLAAPTDLRLGPASFAVDAGNDTLVPGGLLTDLAGLPRFFDDPSVPDTGIGPPGTPIVDMGAYERIPLTVSTPAGHTVCSGASVVFSVTATGQEPLTYQWRKDGVDLVNGGAISGAKTPTLIINPVASLNSGSYAILVTDNFDQSLASGPAVLTVNTTPTASATGIADICSGDSTEISGSGGLTCSWTPITGLDNPGSCTPTATPASTTTYALTVMATNGCASTNNATVTVTVTPTPTAPVITAPVSLPVGASGASASVPLHSGSIYNWTLTGGAITGGQTTRQIAFDAGPAGTTMMVSVVESSGGCESPVSAKKIQVDFSDTPPSNPFHDFVNTVARNGVTVGCGGGKYCGGATIQRSEMAVFLLKSKFGASHVPPPATGTVFLDVHVNDFAAAWIEELASLGVTGGCGMGNYCPTNPVTRAEMAVFLLKTLMGIAYTPSPATGLIFSDVHIGDFAADWIEDLYSRNVTGGCQGPGQPAQYCPNSPNTREQMAVFVTRTFSLQ
jgi:parallel beta-helix repeat protein